MLVSHTNCITFVMGGPNRKTLPAVVPEPQAISVPRGAVFSSTPAHPQRTVANTPQGRISMLSSSVLLQRIAAGNTAGKLAATPARPASMGNVRRSLDLLAPVVETGVETHTQPPSTPHNTSAPQLTSSLKKRTDWIADKVKNREKGSKEPEDPHRMYTQDLERERERQSLPPLIPNNSFTTCYWLKWTVFRIP